MWALKRKALILFVFIFFLLFGLFVTYEAFIKKDPTCFDGIKNGNEEGVDCGGMCDEICKLRANRVNVLWSKSFEVSKGVSNIAALVENPNFDYNIITTYDIKTFDDEGIRINDFTQRIKLKPAEKRLIFIPSIQTGGSKISKTFIDFREIESLTEGKREKKSLIVTSKIISQEDNQTRLSIGIKNTSLAAKRNIEVVAALSNKKGEVVDVAKTFLEYLNKREESVVNVTWQRNIDNKNLRIDIYLREVQF